MKTLKTLVFSTFLTISFIYSANAQQVNPAVSTQEQLAESVKLVPCEMKERLEAVKKMFISVGAKEEDVKVEQFKDISNVVVTKKGKSDETIIIGAHYDKTKEGCGAIDNWTGISIIAHIYRTISKFDTEKTYIFVAFDKEELGLLGSKEMAKAIPKEKRQNYCSMVNIDSFGVGIPQAMSNISSSKMLKYAKELAKETKFPFAEVTIPNASSDSASFRDKGIPAIGFSGLDNKWQTYLHNKEDKFEKVNMQSVYLGYQFVLNFVVKLDTETCQNFR
ncbi:MAG: M20/M25/M40 family metallo-hydrolase [Acidobacteriota bacterium]